jgi:superfamily II RNA helicase
VPTLEEHFSPDWIIERTKCNTYSRLVCEKFNHLIVNEQNSAVDAIAETLNSLNMDGVSYPEPKPIRSLIVDFVLTLKEKNLLPCIVFSDKRWLCEQMAASVTKYFEEVENDLRRTKYKYQIEAIEKRLIEIEEAQKEAKNKKPDKSRRRRGNDKNDNDNGEVQQGEEEDQTQSCLSGHEQNLLNGILEEGTLANRRGCNQKLVDAFLNRSTKRNQTLVDYMKRGVAFHHAGVDNRGRIAVEALFRNRYVQIVFSTSTLCK